MQTGGEDSLLLSTEDGGAGGGRNPPRPPAIQAPPPVCPQEAGELSRLSPQSCENLASQPASAAGWGARSVMTAVSVLFSWKAGVRCQSSSCLQWPPAGMVGGGSPASLEPHSQSCQSALWQPHSHRAAGHKDRHEAVTTVTRAAIGPHVINLLVQHPVTWQSDL